MDYREDVVRSLKVEIYLLTVRSGSRQDLTGTRALCSTTPELRTVFVPLPHRMADQNSRNTSIVFRHSGGILAVMYLAI